MASTIVAIHRSIAYYRLHSAKSKQALLCLHLHDNLCSLSEFYERPYIRVKRIVHQHKQQSSMIRVHSCSFVVQRSVKQSSRQPSLRPPANTNERQPLRPSRRMNICACISAPSAPSARGKKPIAISTI